MRPTPLALAAAAALTLSCGELTRPTLGTRSAALVAVEGCEDAAAQVRARAIAQMTARLDRNLELTLSRACFGGRIGDDAVPPVADPAGGPGEDGGDGAPSGWSGTNDQVGGVDEPDLVKTDGTHLYVVAGGRLQILSAWPARETRRIGQLELPGTPKRLLVHGDRAVVFSSLPAEGGAAAPPPGGAMPDLPYEPRDCTYGYDCVPQGDGRPLAVSFVDLTDRTAPARVREVRFSGSFLAARRIGDAVHVAVTSPERWIEGLDHGESLLCQEWSNPYLVRERFEELRARNRAILEAVDFADWLPAAVDVSYRDGAPRERPLFAGCGGFYAAPDADGTAFLSVASFELGNDDTAGLTTTLGRPGWVYASGETLFVAAPHAWHGGEWFWREPAADAEATTIHAFRLRPAPGAGSDYAGSGVVPGRVLNSFALDSHGGHLRVATTIGWFGPEMRSRVTVLRETGAALEEVGVVDGIAPGEDLRAVRFDGDRGFVVTFEKTDPLFVLDLAEPVAPRVVGELVVPGFSTYLHRIDPAHLLTIGFDADPDLGFSWFAGIRLQVFDVGDPAHPALDHAEVIGSRGTASEAATDHLAFNWFPPKDLLAVPMVVCEGGGDGWYGTEPTFNGLLVYRVTPESGFTALGGVSHPLPATEPWASPCAGFWTQSSSFVKRSVFVEDFVYSLTTDELRVQDTRALGDDLARVDLAAP